VEPGELIAGRYAIDALCAAGGMAVVYRATDTAPDGVGRVALKVLRSGAGPSELERFKREGAALAALVHPSIVRVLDRGVTPLGESFIVQEWIDGPTLRERMRTSPTLTAHDSVVIARAVAGALAVAHARNMVHRDVKPSNIMLAGGDPAAVKVVDFGIARIVEGPALRLTRTGAVVGTVNYMAPEQARGMRDVDPRADVFALGAVLYECLAGREPFRGKNALSTRAKIIALDPRPLTALSPDLPASLSRLVARMLSKDPADRPADGAAVAEELAALGEIPPVPAPFQPSDAPETWTDSQDEFTCVVMSAPAGPLLGRTVDELRVEVGDVSAAFGCAGAVMDDGSALITAPADGSPVVRAAATTRAALILKRRWDVVPIAVAGGKGGHHADRSLDERATAIDAVTVEAVFADYGDSTPRHGVLIEPEVAALIGDDFEIEGEPGALRVLAERAPTGTG
jgi:hypothetical protein